MFNDEFYAIFDTKYTNEFIMCYKNTIVYGKEIRNIMKKFYNTEDIETCYKLFAKDIDEAYREYARVCHIHIIYDDFTQNMKDYLEKCDDIYYLCEIQNMSDRNLFMMFNTTDRNLLYEVAEFIFVYKDKKEPYDPHNS